LINLSLEFILPLDFAFNFLYSNTRSTRIACREIVAALFFSKNSQNHFSLFAGIQNASQGFSFPPTKVVRGPITQLCTVQVGIDLRLKKEYSNSD
jgi:hypothetical protein